MDLFGNLRLDHSVSVIPRGSIYITIRELAPKFHTIEDGSQFPNAWLYMWTLWDLLESEDCSKLASRGVC